MAKYPENFRYNPETDELSWDPAENSELYLIEKQISEVEPWEPEYEGPDTFCIRNLPPGVYYYKGRAKETGNGWGVFCPPEKVVVP